MEPDRDEDRIRRALADLGADADSAPEVPAEVSARIGAALRTAGPAHSIDRPRLGRLQKAGLVVGVAAVLAALVAGVAMLSRDPEPSWSTGPTANRMTAPRVPLSDPQIIGLLSTPTDYGPLADPRHRAACLAVSGHADAPVLGARPVDMAGRPAVVLVLPGDDAETLLAVVVGADCSAAHPGPLADTEVTRP